MKRFEMKTGKFGYYFYDNVIQIDMPLEMVLNRLNYLDNQLNKEKEKNYNQTKEINNLTGKLLLKGVIV